VSQNFVTALAARLSSSRPSAAGDGAGRGKCVRQMAIGKSGARCRITTVVLRDSATCHIVSIPEFSAQFCRSKEWSKGRVSIREQRVDIEHPLRVVVIAADQRDIAEGVPAQSTQVAAAILRNVALACKS
jgi:hypothetical protein